MLEPQPLDRVVQLDVHAQVVGVQLQLVAIAQAAVLGDVHRQRRDRPVDRQPPVPVTGRIGLETDQGTITATARLHGGDRAHRAPGRCCHACPPRADGYTTTLYTLL